MCETRKIKVKQKEKKKTIENQFIFRDQKEEQFRQDNIRTK